MESLKKYATATLVVKNSKFLAEAFPCKSATQARALIASQKEKYKKASHLVHAFVIGPKCEIMGKSDNGEPSGTAGEPCLNVLRHSNLTDILVTIARWFGGTKLGTGGLVKAYTQSTKEVLAKVADNTSPKNKNGTD